MIVSGGENVFPARGRGPARGPRGDRRGGGLRRRRRGVRPAAEGRRRRARRARSSTRGRASRSYVKSNLAGYKVPRDVEFVDELPRNVDRQGAQARAAGRREEAPRTVAPSLSVGGMPQRTDIFDLARLGLTSGEGRRLELHVARRAVRRSAASATRSSPTLVPGAARRLAHDRQRLGAAAALRASRCAGPCMRCLEPADAALRGRRARGRPARAAARSSSSPYVDDDEELDLAAWARDALALALPAQITCRQDCAGLCAAVRREPQRGARPRARGRARPALGEAVASSSFD